MKIKRSENVLIPFFAFLCSALVVGLVTSYIPPGYRLHWIFLSLGVFAIFATIFENSEE